jgi:hypothetical protein
VRKVLSSGTAEVPSLERASRAEAHTEEIKDLLAQCKGNLVRVHEELLAKGLSISYPALTAFCRRESIGHAPPRPAGHYDFGPGQEMQHDTSPHRAVIGGTQQRIETASLVLCYSRMLFFQCSAAFNRFVCKVFLTDALTYLQGAAGVCMIDNTHVVVASGTGREMVPAPEMAAFADRFHFVFHAHEKGDANRSARVERPFRFIEGNFLAGRSFADFDDLNRQARDFCDKVNAKTRRHLHGSARDLFAAERAHLRPLPPFVPEVYALHHRIVDVEGFVCLDRHRYSVPYVLIGRQLEIRETRDRVDAYLGPRLVASHHKASGRQAVRMTAPEHRPRRGEAPEKRTPPEEQELTTAGEPLRQYTLELKRHSAGRGTLALRRLLALYREYPREAVEKAVATALEYGLFDLERLERLILRTIAKDYFVLPGGRNTDDDD